MPARVAARRSRQPMTARARSSRARFREATAEIQHLAGFASAQAKTHELGCASRRDAARARGSASWNRAARNRT
jgi:hypothetical protein